MSRIEWGSLSAAEIMAMQKRDAIIIVPVGSIEQHGPHLPVQVDALLVREVARRTALRVAESQSILVTPVIWFGLAEHHMAYGGTITLDFQTFLAVIRGVCRSLVRHGFRRILLLNGHGGNIAALNVIVGELTIELQCPFATATYWLAASKQFGAILEKQENVCHACEAETSMMMAIEPGLVATEALHSDLSIPPRIPDSGNIYRWHSFTHWTESGVIGFPRFASAAKGHRLLEAAAERLSNALTEREVWSNLV